MRFLSLLLLILFPVAISAQSITKVHVSGKTPEGVSIQKNKVFIKKGYVVQQTSGNSASVMSRMNNNTTGSFSCGCSAGGGGCKVLIEGSSITCIDSGCTKGVCEMSVSIPAIKMRR